MTVHGFAVVWRKPAH